MLVMTRNPGEAVIIGGVVRVTFIADKGEHGIKIGFEGPDNIKFVREEIFEGDVEVNIRLQNAKNARPASEVSR